jgi:NAD(P)-dependent dehydrogenase (short-subunit alcohol dehydrogenase family)
MGSAVEPGYCAAKAGLLGLTRSLARAVARKGVTVNLVVPGDHQARHRVAWPQFSAPSPVISERPGRPAGADSDCGPAAGAAGPQSIGSLAAPGHADRSRVDESGSAAQGRDQALHTITGQRPAPLGVYAGDDDVVCGDLYAGDQDGGR